MIQFHIMEVGRSAVDHLVKAHYLHRWPGVVTAILALMDRSRPIGVIVFAMPPREMMKRYEVILAWELARLYIYDGTPKNTESWFVARAIAWVREHHPTVQLLVSYADPSVGHSGVIYRAGNWISDGRTDQERKTPRFDYTTPGKEVPLFGVNDPVKHGRAGHVRKDINAERIPRVSKWRFIYWLDGKHEKRRVENRSARTVGAA